MVFILKLLLKISLLFVINQEIKAQNPGTATLTTIHEYRGIWTRPGLPVIDCPMWLRMRDSTELHIMPKALIMDSLFNVSSFGAPSNFLWVDPTTKLFKYSIVDSLSLPQYLLKTDTSALLTAYLRKQDTTAMLLPYLRDLDSSAMLSGYVRKGDTASMLVPYLRKPLGIDTISSSRSFNFAYQLSASRWSQLWVSATISCSLSLTSGQSGEVFLEYSADGSTNWTLCGKISGSNTGTLTIGLNTTQLSGSQLSILLPPGYYWRMRTNNVTGTPTYTLHGGSKIIY